MTPYHSEARVTVWQADCLDILPTLPDCSADVVITDPPYGLSNTDSGHVIETLTRWLAGERDYLPGGSGFMGKQWDAFVPPPAVWDHCLRILKPGGHALVFAGTRTLDLMVLAMRLARFEIRDDILAWLYGSGFPKSRDVSKAIDAEAGAERESLGPRIRLGDGAAYADNATSQTYGTDNGHGGWRPDRTASATDAARQWQGWGTALKPAHEPIIVARKPLVGTVAANVLTYGTGALNIDAARIGVSADDAKAMERANTPGSHRMRAGSSPIGTFGRSSSSGPLDTTKGRWPANVALDESQAAALDQMSGELQTGGAGNAGDGKVRGSIGPTGLTRDHVRQHAGSSGGASRFFYTAKASAAERVTSNGVSHPTVKPLALMRWLARLATPARRYRARPVCGVGGDRRGCPARGFPLRRH